jgi:transcriptional regulator with XRE-family HTH domain
VIEWRAIHKLTQRTFAKEHARVSVAAVQSLEAGTRITRRSSLERIAAALTLTLEELLAPLDPARPDPPTPDARDVVVDTSVVWELLRELLPDTLDVAWQYQCADGELKTAIKETLRHYYARQMQRRAAGPPARVMSKRVADAIDRSRAIVTRTQALRKGHA